MNKFYFSLNHLSLSPQGKLNLLWNNLGRLVALLLPSQLICWAEWCRLYSQTRFQCAKKLISSRPWPVSMHLVCRQDAAHPVPQLPGSCTCCAPLPLPLADKPAYYSSIDITLLKLIAGRTTLDYWFCDSFCPCPVDWWLTVFGCCRFTFTQNCICF